MHRDPTNPFTPPAADPLGVATNREPVGTVTEGILEQLRGTRPWARFLSVLGFIGCGFMGLGALMMMVMPSVLDVPFGGFVLGLVYLVFGAVWMVPTIFLHRFASGITELLISRSTQSLELTLSQQRSFWRVSGIIMAAVLGLYVVGIFVAIAFAAIGR